LIRNTRSAIDLKLPRRFATTLRIEPSQAEKKIYEGITEYLRNNSLNRMTTNLLLREAGSSPFALRETLLQLPGEGSDKNGLIERMEGLGDVSKGIALIDILKKNSVEKKVVFTQYLKSRRPHRPSHEKDTLCLQGNPSREKTGIYRFREDVPVLVSTNRRRRKKPSIL
jgi:hypothetical protein